jgi:asparagine synthase (glutamine-hydrolysing)
VDWTPSYLVPDERKDIRSTVQYAGNISDQYLDFRERNPYTEIDSWLDIMEMPYKFFENAAWVRGIHETASQQNIGLLLSGARGNFTISWGPALYYYAELMKKFRMIKLHKEVKKYSRLIDARKSRILKAAKNLAYPKTETLEDEPPTLISSHLAERTKVYEKLEQQGFDLTNDTPSSIYTLRTEHFNQLNVWNATGTNRTKLSLRYNVQTHDPTNDLRIIKFCMSVPIKHFFGNGMDRGLIRRASKGYLPDNVRLNQLTRGFQGADIIQRLKNSWGAVYEEIHELLHDPVSSQYLNVEAIRNGLNKVKRDEVPSNFAFDPDFRIVMRGLIVHRFLKSLKGGEIHEKRMANACVRST